MAVRPRLVAAAVVVVTLGAGGYFATRIWLTDHTDPIRTADAVDDYRASTLPGASSNPTTIVGDRPSLITPSPGVYRYRTEGSESVDVLGGTTHTYPAETSLTVVPHGCGVTLRWTPLEQRSEEWGLCATVDGMELQTEGAFFHEFFGTAHPESMVCDRTVVLVPAAGSMTTEVAQKCDVDGRPWFPVWKVLERSTRTVDGTSVDVTHVRMTIRDDDREYEHVDLDMWLDPHGLPVEMSAERRSLTLTAAIGAVVYTEQYRATLVSLEPMR